MKALVTGGTGFLGANIVNHLIQQGHETRVLMRKTSSTKAIDDLEYEKAWGDITDPASLAPAMNGVDWVFHVAASVSMWKGNWKQSHEINVGGTRNMVEAALKAGVKRFVHTSSISSLGVPKDGEVGDESLEWSLPFDFAYNHSKREGEKEVQKGVRQGLQAVILNPGMILGERDVNLNGGSMLLDIRGGKMPICPPGGNGVCDADAVAKAHIAAAERGAVGERHIVAGMNVTFKELFETVADVVGGKAPSLYAPAGVAHIVGKTFDFISIFTNKEPDITFDKAFWSSCKNYYTSKKAQRLLGFEIAPIRASIEKCYNWYLKQGIMKPL
ncbi:MAG: NAD-dependent epimerase/dehydratase family protein [bacterium]